MAVPVVAVELCDRRPTSGRSAAAVSKLPAVAHRLGWVLALAACAAAGRTDLDSPGSMFGVSALARAPAGPGAVSTKPLANWALGRGTSSGACSARMGRLNLSH